MACSWDFTLESDLLYCNARWLVNTKREDRSNPDREWMLTNTTKNVYNCPSFTFLSKTFNFFFFFLYFPSSSLSSSNDQTYFACFGHFYADRNNDVVCMLPTRNMSNKVIVFIFAMVTSNMDENSNASFHLQNNEFSCSNWFELIQTRILSINKSADRNNERQHKIRVQCE